MISKHQGLFDISALMFGFQSTIYCKAMTLTLLSRPCWRPLLPLHFVAAQLPAGAWSHLCFDANQGGGSQPCSPLGKALSVSNILILDNDEICMEQEILLCVYHALVYKVNKEKSVIWLV